MRNNLICLSSFYPFKFLLNLDELSLLEDRANSQFEDLRHKNCSLNIVIMSLDSHCKTFFEFNESTRYFLPHLVVIIAKEEVRIKEVRRLSRLRLPLFFGFLWVWINSIGLLKFWLGNIFLRFTMWRSLSSCAATLLHQRILLRCILNALFILSRTWIFQFIHFG